MDDWHFRMNPSVLTFNTNLSFYRTSMSQHRIGSITPWKKTAVFDSSSWRFKSIHYMCILMTGRLLSQVSRNIWKNSFFPKKAICHSFTDRKRKLDIRQKTKIISDHQKMDVVMLLLLSNAPKDRISVAHAKGQLKSLLNGPHIASQDSANTNTII